MKSFIIISFLIIIPFIFTYIYENPAKLPNNYPFSIKKSNSESIIFLKDSITFFDVTKTETGDPPLENKDLSSIGILCPSGKEKGGIFSNGYYYTSCSKYDNSNEFQIIVFDSSLSSLSSLVKIYPSNTQYYSISSGTIRFFKYYLTQSDSSITELVGIVWVNNAEFNIVFLDSNEITIYRHYPMSHISRDVDCLFFNTHNRLVCVLGVEDNGYYQCAANIFIYNIGDEDIFTSNLKIWNVCTSHQSRKIRANTNRSGDPNIFYYYYIDTNNDAYILQMTLVNTVTIEVGTPLQVMAGCNEYQHSFDMAEDTFMGYNVFICVEFRYKKRIKIQLFKIENDKITFYGDRSLYNPFEFNDKFNSEISMVNFIVLKDTLNFGFLSYKTEYDDQFAYYTIFNQPGCENYEISMGAELFQNREITMDFTNLIKNDGYDKGYVEIVSDSEGMDLEVVDSTHIKFKSIDYITGELHFVFKVRNDYYESDNCVATVKVKDCFEGCYTCSILKTDFFEQECEEGCKEPEYYPIINFPKTINSNCCKKDNCKDYLYLNGNKYEICDKSCLACNGGTAYNCVTCYNSQTLYNDYSYRETIYINAIKQDPTPTWFYWENAEKKRCLNRDDELYIYLDPDTLTYMDCYRSCKKCYGAGTLANHNCDGCRENRDYFHFESTSSPNCFQKEEIPPYYFLYDDDYIAGELIQTRFWKRCTGFCNKCVGSNANDCTECTINSYPKCSEKTWAHFECFNKIPNENYFLNKTLKCYEECHTNCKTCDKGRENDINNCISCEEGQILFNRNCYDNCPFTHYELDHKKCVLDCPEYTIAKTVFLGQPNESKQCFNCAEIGKCIYLGADPSLKDDCVPCTISQTFLSNIEYGILNDCYELCETCSQSGTVIKMNCNSCLEPNHCLVKDSWNCIPNDSEIDYYYKTSEFGTCVFNNCYETCKTCTNAGNSNFHNCLTCKEGYQYDLIQSGNCVKLCEYYWYMDTIGTDQIFTCTLEPECPIAFPYLVTINNQCVSGCSSANYGYPLFKYKNTCLVKCPQNSMEVSSSRTCYSLDNEVEVFNYATNYISEREPNVNNLLLYTSDKKKYFYLFNTTKIGIEVYHNISKVVGTSIIDLSKCLSNLIQIYGYNNDEVFYIGILDLIRDDTSASQFEYIIYDHSGGQLNNDHCINSEIIINKSLIHSDDIFLAKEIMEDYNYDIIDYNTDNPFFCDICSFFDYNYTDPYDVLLNDRYKYYYEDIEYYFCEETCNSKMTKIDLNNSEVQCICKGKNNLASYQKQNFQKFEKNPKKCSDWFMQYLKCYKNVFNKNLFGNNIGNYFIFFFIIFQIFTLLMYFLISKRHIIDYILQVLMKNYKKIISEDDNNQIEKEIITSKNQSNQNSENISIDDNEKSSKSENTSKSRTKSSKESGSSEKSQSSRNDIISKSSKTGSKTNDNNEDSNSGSKNSVSNPPKDVKKKRKNIYDDGDDDDDEEKKSKKVENKGAPKPMYLRYAKSFI